ncbi:hydroxymethylglutaryl-CoA reductase [Secundilactobacillus oryzae JCM 18671]|uniref:3-hydroxy-3-methylglutaryl coenzyme A reductase n=2 Tax=Secundilactobacillus oryzae TaxID=1202668 RepID=A0A081BH71_9LACO|nr:hydroxymethylglutaryl-CoA reductase, degradative [Secundilactobacillus oryzae]GAK47389.1 hydroxymethylglutaryl-CoA reductase [Secundilactobacillus oryzae JCM 18671]
MTERLDHFYRLTDADRLEKLETVMQLTDQEVTEMQQSQSADTADLIENYVTDFHLPQGLAPNFLIDGKLHHVPMVTEEPSVIAAASNGARMAGLSGGFQVTILNREMIGQILLQDIANVEEIERWITAHQVELCAIANAAHPSVLKHGRGATELRVRALEQGYVSVDLVADVGEAMGANTLDSMLEAVAEKIETELDVTVVMSILSNLATESLTTAKVTLDFATLATEQFDGKQVAERIVQAGMVAKLDPYRATTHNKGIMNGVDAVVMAMGNDWRAIESGAHAYASQSGRYQPLSSWTIQADRLVGQLTLPLPVAVIGGATRVLPQVAINQKIADVKTARDLMAIVASVGLAQNLAALKALVTDGIQKGHMALQLKSLARTAGATHNEVAEVVTRLRELPHPDLTDAKKLIQQLRQN